MNREALARLLGRSAPAAPRENPEPATPTGPVTDLAGLTAVPPATDRLGQAPTARESVEPEPDEPGAFDGPDPLVSEAARTFRIPLDRIAVRPLPAPICLTCRGRRFWRSVFGVTTCARCHPPTAERLVAEWVGSLPAAAGEDA